METTSLPDCTSNSEPGVSFMDSELLNRLHVLGVQVDIDLPKIAIVGNRGTGKSSLIEAISGIKIPRAVGTHTRCPMECRLSRSNSPWTCTVSLITTTDSMGQPIDKPSNEPFGPPIYHKGELEDRIRRAQLAVLNPLRPVISFLKDDEAGDHDKQTLEEVFVEPPQSLKFSMNCVSLTITGPDVMDLSFVDLPGLTAGGDGALVEGLVRSYIKKPNCVILLMVTCETSFENQGGYMLARACDPEGERTVGVLTKPDRIPLGEEFLWLPYIRNKRVPLKNNWFCVKQPSSDDLKQHWTWEQAREKESDFFANSAPWKGLEDTYLVYLKTRSLMERLGSILGGLNRKCFADIQQVITDTIAKTREEVDSLPSPPPKDPLGKVVELMTGYASRMQVECIPDNVTQSIRVLCEDFRKAIRETAPDFSSSIDLQKEEDLPGGESSDSSERYLYVDIPQEFYSQDSGVFDYLPLVTKLEFFKEILPKWSTAAGNLCEEIYVILLEHTRKLVHQYFASCGQGELENQIQLIMHDDLNQNLLEAKRRVNWLLEIQREPSFIHNLYPSLPHVKETCLIYYRRTLNVSKTNSKFASGDREDIEPILEIMATTRAYFEVAYKQFNDNVLMAADYELLRRGGRDIFRMLWGKLGFGLGGPVAQDICGDYMREAGHFACRRNELRKKLNNLAEALAQVENLQMDCHSPTGSQGADL